MIIRKSTSEERVQIGSAIDEYNNAQIPFRVKPQRLDFSIIDGTGSLIGGVLAEIGYWGGAEVSVLWVAHSHRNQGVGRKLLGQVENETKKLGGTLIRTDTFDFHSKGFYEKLGYEIFGELKGFPMDSNTQYFLRKFL